MKTHGNTTFTKGTLRQRWKVVWKLLNHRGGRARAGRHHQGLHSSCALNPHPQEAGIGQFLLKSLLLDSFNYPHVPSGCFSSLPLWNHLNLGSSGGQGSHMVGFSFTSRRNGPVNTFKEGPPSPSEGRGGQGHECDYCNGAKCTTSRDSVKFSKRECHS